MLNLRATVDAMVRINRGNILPTQSGTLSIYTVYIVKICIHSPGWWSRYNRCMSHKRSLLASLYGLA